jgi:hypothetical protein
MHATGAISQDSDLGTARGAALSVAAILGHSSAEVMLRYAHLQPGNFTEQERAFLDVQLAAKVLPMAAARAEFCLVATLVLRSDIDRSRAIG